MKDLFTIRLLQFLNLLFIINTVILAQDKITPKMPESNIDLIYQEGEDAIVTNFATAATLNYSASGQRTLQLSTYTGNYQSGAYFAEYSVYVEEAGEYTFWYSGTPPGTREDVYPSYSSPFSLIIDDVSVKKYREDVNVVETYAPGLYWVNVETVNLDAGYHNIRLEITDKRGFDGKYYFYLDSFFLFKGDEYSPGVVPEIFPKNMQDRSIDSAFREISFYQNNIKNDPTVFGNYMSLANIYILIGDYLNAIKMLTRASQIEPLDKTAKLLLAQTRIWNGDTDKGIQLYESYLTQFPKSLSVWEEAGKIAAWVGKYDKSIDIFKRGLLVYPDSISLNINLALTYLWNAMVIEGLDLLEAQEKTVSNSLDKIIDLADVYSVNGYPDYATNLYEDSITKNPDFIELYLNLEKLYRDNDQNENADKVISKIEDRFYISDQLKNIMDTNTKKLNIKNLFIKDLEAKIELDPLNLELRELLVQTLFWNGIVEKAIKEYKAIITVNHYDESLIFESDSLELYNNYDKLKYIIKHFNKNSTLLYNKKLAYYNALINYRTAIINDMNEEKTNQELNNIINDINNLLKKNNFLYEQFDLLKESMGKLNLVEQESEELFQNIIKGNGWALNEDYLINELKEMAENDSNKAFANFILARYFLIKGSFDESNKIIDTLDQFSSKSKLLKYHNNLWNGKDSDINLVNDITSYFNELSSEKVMLTELDLITAEPVEISRDFLNVSNSIVDKIETEQNKVNNFKKILSKYEKEQRSILNKKLIRSIYKHQENTHLIRYKIGDYYLQSEKYPEALTQFNQVIAIDPFNISAQFNLGRLQQLTGDWKNSLDSYEEVFSVDPAYENAATMHNQLSKLHPEFTTGAFDFYIDTSRLEYNVEFSTDMNLTSWLSISPYWNGSTFSYFTWDDIGTPRSYRVDDFLLNTEISLLEGDLKIAPSLGMSVANDKFDDISPLEDIDYESILSSGVFTPNLSLLISNNIENFTLTGALSYKQIPESIPGDITDITSLKQSYTVTGYFPINGRKALSSLSFRTLVEIDDRTGFDHDNRIYTLAQDFYSTFILLKDPWTTQVIYSATSFENSLEDDDSIYYTPDKVLISKIGGTTSSYIGINGGILSLSGRVASGVYIENAFDEPDASFTADSDAKITYEKNNKSLYMKIYGAGSFSETTTPDYWALQFSLGFNISLFKLLAP